MSTEFMKNHPHILYKRTQEILRMSGVTENDLIEDFRFMFESHEFLKKGFKLPLKLMVKGIVFNSKLSAIHEGSSLARGVDL